MKLKYLARLGLIGFYTFAAAITTNLPASASIIRKVAASQVTGETAQLQTVKVWNGHGVSISFYRTGEIIKKIWLDDPSKFVFDVDGCLEGLGRCSQKSTGAGLIHIRRIEKVKIPGLPQATYGAHMTVITESGSTRKSYHFRIVPGSGKPEYSQIEIIGDTPSKPEEVKPKVSYTALSDSRYISRGMQVALSNQWVVRDSKLWQRLNKLVELRSLGEELVVAANSAGVSMQLVEKLMLLGGKRLIEVQPPQRNNPPTATPTTAQSNFVLNQNQ
ncbi:hypothetical protein WA1_50475 [Scytonema hofmannii PCC 7110]|uniref:Uncharacterized protein n=1 Tax=Scytonema hofmannii PCC 7110 TaxID=128403 RepID=A0A139WQD8_9CYAN|nr:hypothetical protein [Scytonema hofmannii]KYC34644.1 hypothetical protein WA1_50475 [Scytonema hofmannii PCC 7110]